MDEKFRTSRQRVGQVPPRDERQCSLAAQPSSPAPQAVSATVDIFRECGASSEHGAAAPLGRFSTSRRSVCRRPNDSALRDPDYVSLDCPPQAENLPTRMGVKSSARSPECRVTVPRDSRVDQGRMALIRFKRSIFRIGSIGVPRQGRRVAIPVRTSLHSGGFARSEFEREARGYGHGVLRGNVPQVTIQDLFWRRVSGLRQRSEHVRCASAVRPARSVARPRT